MFWFLAPVHGNFWMLCAKVPAEFYLLYFPYFRPLMRKTDVFELLWVKLIFMQTSTGMHSYEIQIKKHISFSKLNYFFTSNISLFLYYINICIDWPCPGLFYVMSLHFPLVVKRTICWNGTLSRGSTQRNTVVFWCNTQHPLRLAGRGGITFLSVHVFVQKSLWLLLCSLRMFVSNAK